MSLLTARGTALQSAPHPARIGAREVGWFVVPYASTQAVLGSLFFAPHIPSEAPLLFVGWTLIFEMFFYAVFAMHYSRSGVS